MSSKPLIPTLLPAELPADVKRLYREAVTNGGYDVKIDAADTTKVALAQALAEYGLADVEFGKNQVTVSALRLNPAYTSLARPVDPDETGRRRLIVEVWETDRDWVHPTEATLIATLSGASMRFLRDRPMPQCRITLRDPDTTDVEHDAAYLADLTITSPTLNDVTARRTQFTGIITAARMREFGFTFADTDDTAEACTMTGDREDNKDRCFYGRRLGHLLTDTWTPRHRDEDDALIGKQVVVIATSVKNPTPTA